MASWMSHATSMPQASTISILDGGAKSERFGTFNEVHSLIHKKPAKLLAELEKGEAHFRSKSDPGRFEFTDLSFGSARAAAQQRPQGRAASPPPKRWRNHAEP